ncbi:MAG: ABC transporter permease [Halanaerobiaceae bacterium]|nr:ABC transporter permease [Halanaerobiaceae bacterium]
MALNKKMKPVINYENIRNNFSRYYLYLMFLVIIIISSILTPYFLSLTNIINILRQNAVITILAVGQLFVILTGGIDLSVGSIVALSSCLIAGLLNTEVFPVLAVIIVLLIMAVIGGISGSLISYGKAAPFLVTFSMMSVIRGVAYNYQVGLDLRINNKSFINGIIGQINQFPLLIFYMFIIIIIMAFILKKTVFGRIIVAIGGS